MSSDSDLSNSFAESNQERLKEENKFEQLSQTSEVIEQSVTESTLQDLVKTGVVDMVEMYRASEEKPLAHGSDEKSDRRTVHNNPNWFREMTVSFQVHIICHPNPHKISNSLQDSVVNNCSKLNKYILS